MKFTLITLFVAITASVIFCMPKDVQIDLNIDGMKCPICEMIVKQSEIWLGKEGEERENAVIALCDKELSSLGVYGKMFCEAFVKDELTNIIQHMENTGDESKDANKVCTAVGLCKKSN
uniref:Saposin B-type domain-containing protein n=1 Tax=Parastrongyloides trichosuri TaxID=131310 RepID=A0A0N4Z0E7_PARTI